MKNIIINTLFFLVAITAHAQLTNWQNISSNNFVMKIIHDQNYLYVGTKGGGIVLNEVTKITLDPLHDLIWLTNHPGLGLSVAHLNCHNTAAHSIATPLITTTTYDLSGRRIANSKRGIYIKEGKKYLKK